MGKKTAITDTKPRTGMESATTVDVCNSAITHGNERQDVALGAAGCCVHGAKNNRVRQHCSPRALAGLANATSYRVVGRRRVIRICRTHPGSSGA
jgi:hypothetical protein